MEKDDRRSLIERHSRQYGKTAYYHHLIPVTALAIIGFSLILWPAVPSASDSVQSATNVKQLAADAEKVLNEALIRLKELIGDPNGKGSVETPKTVSAAVERVLGKSQETAKAIAETQQLLERRSALHATIGNIAISQNAFVGMRYGFLGAFLFVIQVLYRRFTTQDLLPSVYLYFAILLALGIGFNFVAFEAIDALAGNEEHFGAAGKGAAAILAFSLGYFPAMAAEWFSRRARRLLETSSRSEALISLLRVAGISDMHEARLREEGIDNLQNLANADLGKLMIDTPFGAAQLIDWIDQAILYQYLDPNETPGFRSAGIITFSALLCRAKDDGKLESAAEAIGITKERLAGVRDSVWVAANRQYVLKYLGEDNFKGCGPGDVHDVG